MFSCYIEEYVNCVPSSGALGGMASFGPLGPGHSSHHPVNTYLCLPTIDVARIFSRRVRQARESHPSVPLGPHGLQKWPQLLLIKDPTRSRVPLTGDLDLTEPPDISKEPRWLQEAYYASQKKVATAT